MTEINKIKILTVLIAAGAVVVAGIFAISIAGYFEEEEPSGEIIKITSDAELKSFLEKYQKNYEYFGPDTIVDAVLGVGMNKASQEEISYEASFEGRDMSSPPIPAPTMAPTSAPAASKGSSASDYSQTNIQVKGVDEADFVKNDGKYIYIVSGNRLLIADSYPPKDASIVYEGSIKGQGCSALFLKDDMLVVFSNHYTERWITPAKTTAPVPVTEQITLATVYDISERNNPKILREIQLPGTYENSRMIGDYIYAVSRNSVSGYSENIMPVVRQDGEIIAKPDVWCPPINEYNYVMHTVTSFCIKDGKDVKSGAFLTGWDNTLYVSENNIYMAYERYLPYSSDFGIEPAADDAASSYEERQNTVIHRFSIDKGDIKYRATGTVSGSLLNQWSLDEFEKNLRVATTVSGYGNDESFMYSCVYVLDESLKTIGRLEHIAPDERIYSARFTGDLLYLVTFKQMDPFFVIDLSNPRQPGILGELKIPGYSDYLHPYDKTHIIGIGKSTEENKWGGVTASGLKIALFNVADLNNPVLDDEIIIGESGTNSEVLSDHRAFLFDYNKNIMVIPVYEITKVPVEDSRYEDSYSRGSWNGAYVFGVGPDYKFILKGKVQQELTENKNYWYSHNPVRRPVFMDDYLYTISNSRIVMSDLNNLSEIINTLEIDDKNQNTDYYPYYRYGV